MSDQERHAHEYRKKHHQITALRLFILAAFLILWEIAAKTGLIDSFFFASPSITAECFFELTALKNIGGMI
ncbi:MAG: hypothetical protein LUE16_03105 [Lachnospiraceae bacterium]|nr:hypothetical protein [Lachnospiraceae bacterium]